MLKDGLSDEEVYQHMQKYMIDIVRVVLHGQLAVSLFDLRVGGRLGYTQHFVVITFLLCHNPITSRISSNLPYIAAHCRFQYRQPQADLYKPDRPANGSPFGGAVTEGD